MAEAKSGQSWNLTESDLFDSNKIECIMDITNSEMSGVQNGPDLSDVQVNFTIGPDGVENVNYLYYEIDISNLKPNETDISNARRNSDTPSVVSTCTVGSIRSYASDADAMTMFPIRVGTTLWKENPEQDLFNTFSVSEDNLTKIIDYLENVTSKNKTHEGIEATENVINSLQEDFRETVTDKVTFILDTYYSMYMTR